MVKRGNWSGGEKGLLMRVVCEGKKHGRFMAMQKVRRFQGGNFPKAHFADLSGENRAITDPKKRWRTMDGGWFFGGRTKIRWE